MQAWVAVTISLATGCAGVVIGVARERYRWHQARPGYLLGPQAGDASTDPPEWAFPAAPSLYDQALDEEMPARVETPMRQTLQARVGHPLVPDVHIENALVAGMDAVQTALDPDPDRHSRRAS